MYLIVTKITKMTKMEFEIFIQNNIFACALMLNLKFRLVSENEWHF